MSTKPAVEGVFAIDKPLNLTSAQLVNRVKNEFQKSQLFAPLADARAANADRLRGRRRARHGQIKIGHGGTLDPNATGVLILGVGAGTKMLQDFLTGCTKTYEATILFGAATDTYDTDGKILEQADFAHVTREAVAKSLPSFRGKGTQRPPLYSALKMNGKRLCDYAREGLPIPRAIESRNVEVSTLEIVDWYESAEHEYKVKGGEADAESRRIADEVLCLKKQHIPMAAGRKAAADQAAHVRTKRKRSPEADGTVMSKRPALKQEYSDSTTLMSGGLQPSNDRTVVGDSATLKEGRGPAVTLRMTVSSGFYVRSFAHDLGEAVGSLACMCALVRIRQGKYELGKNTLDFKDLEQGEDVWGPQVERLMSDPKACAKH